MLYPARHLCDKFTQPANAERHVEKVAAILVPELAQQPGDRRREPLRQGLEIIGSLNHLLEERVRGFRRRTDHKIGEGLDLVVGRRGLHGQGARRVGVNLIQPLQNLPQQDVFEATQSLFTRTAG